MKSSEIIELTAYYKLNITSEDKWETNQTPPTRFVDPHISQLRLDLYKDSDDW